jgi:hypothetical protein
VVQLLSSAELHPLCLINKRFGIIAESFLYTQIQWTWTNSRNPLIAQFLRTIVHRPELASSVQVVILNGDCFDPSKWDYSKKCPKLSATEVVLDELDKRIQIPYAEQWIQESRWNDGCFYYTFIIAAPQSETSLSRQEFA